MTDRLIGIDFGLSKVGLSISDPLKIISIPLKVIKYKKREELLSKLQEIAMENDVKSFVIGYPLNMNNKKNEMTKLVDDFFEELKNLNFNVFINEWTNVRSFISTFSFGFFSLVFLDSTFFYF